jgi:site-specific DNA recombinase
VQAQIAANRVNRRNGDNVREHSLLAGILLDAEGRRMTPSHAVKGARRYRYYVTHDLDRREGEPAAWRVPAQDIETAVIERIRMLLQDRSAIMGLSGTTSASNLSIALDLAKHAAARLDDPRERRMLISTLIKQVGLAEDHIAIDLDQTRLLDMLGIEHSEQAQDTISLIARTALIRNGQEMKLIVLPDGGRASANDNLVALLAEAQDAYETVIANPSKTINQLAKDAQRCRTRYAQLVRVAMLAPDIVQRCIAGTQPPALTSRTLLSAELPIAWQEQRKMLGCD